MPQRRTICQLDLVRISKVFKHVGGSARLAEHSSIRYRESLAAMRSDKRDYIFRGTVDVASIKIWSATRPQRSMRHAVVQ